MTNRMNYLLVDPRKKRCHLASCSGLDEAMSVVGLVPVGGVDHGLVWRGDVRGLSIVTDGFGLFKEPDEQGIYSIDGRLFVGRAVFYAIDSRGETVSAVRSDMPPITWFQNQRAAELAICRGEVKRPRVAVGDVVLWEWPQPGGLAACERAAVMEADRLLESLRVGGVAVIDDIVIVRL